MTIKNLLVRLLWLAVFLAVIIPLHLTLKEKAYGFAEERAAVKYVPISEEEVHRRAGVPCIRPPGEKIGCQKEINDVEPADAIEAYRKSQSEKYTALGLSLARSGHRQEYDRQYVFPLRETLENSFDVGFGILYVLTSLLAALFLFKWLSSQERLAIGRGIEKIGESAVPQSVKGFASNRKLRKAHEDFQTLKNLHENGLITEEMFQKRKRDLQSELGKNDAFN